MKVRVLVVLLAVLTAAITLRGQGHPPAGQAKPTPPPAKPTPSPVSPPVPVQSRIVTVDLCVMADQLTSKRTGNSFDIRPQGRPPAHLLQHLDVSLSYKNKDQAQFMCSTGKFFSVDSFVKAEILPGESILPHSAEAPFDPTSLEHLKKKSIAPLLSGAPVEKAVGQRYKFSFTIYRDAADPTGQHFDPHLIVKP